MRQKTRFIVIILVLVVLAVGVLITTYVEASSLFTWIDQSQSACINAPVGPVADPHLRHVPGGYDFENGVPQNEGH